MNPGAQLVPADLQKDRDALGRAEQSFRDDPASHRTRDLADHASREARIAELNASTASDSATAAEEKHRPPANPAEPVMPNNAPQCRKDQGCLQEFFSGTLVGRMKLAGLSDNYGARATDVPHGHERTPREMPVS
jgi:hypothetical protein